MLPYTYSNAKEQGKLTYYEHGFRMNSKYLAMLI